MSMEIEINIILWITTDVLYGGSNEEIKMNETGTSQVGTISKAQKYSRNNYWKHLEKSIFLKVAQCRKTQKEAI